MLFEQLVVCIFIIVTIILSIAIKNHCDSKSNNYFLVSSIFFHLFFPTSLLSNVSVFSNFELAPLAAVAVVLLFATFHAHSSTLFEATRCSITFITNDGIK